MIFRPFFVIGIATSIAHQEKRRPRGAEGAATVGLPAGRITTLRSQHWAATHNHTQKHHHTFEGKIVRGRGARAATPVFAPPRLDHGARPIEAAYPSHP
jgi:hypothetical protein